MQREAAHPTQNYVLTIDLHTRIRAAGYNAEWKVFLDANPGKISRASMTTQVRHVRTTYGF